MKWLRKGRNWFVGPSEPKNSWDRQDGDGPQNPPEPENGLFLLFSAFFISSSLLPGFLHVIGTWMPQMFLKCVNLCYY